MTQLPYYERFSHLGQPLGPYLALMGVTGRMDPWIGTELGDLLHKVDLKAISSPIFGPIREDIVFALKSDEHPETQLNGVRLFQLALQFEGETSAVLPVIQARLAERDEGLLLRMITREAEAAKAVFHDLDPATGFSEDSRYWAHLVISFLDTDRSFWNPKAVSGYPAPAQVFLMAAMATLDVRFIWDEAELDGERLMGDQFYQVRLWIESWVESLAKEDPRIVDPSHHEAWARKFVSYARENMFLFNSPPILKLFSIVRNPARSHEARLIAKSVLQALMVSERYLPENQYVARSALCGEIRWFVRRKDFEGPNAWLDQSFRDDRYFGNLFRVYETVSETEIEAWRKENAIPDPVLAEDTERNGVR